MTRVKFSVLSVASIVAYIFGILIGDETINIIVKDSFETLYDLLSINSEGRNFLKLGQINYAFALIVILIGVRFYIQAWAIESYDLFEEKLSDTNNSLVFFDIILRTCWVFSTLIFPLFLINPNYLGIEHTVIILFMLLVASCTLIAIWDMRFKKILEGISTMNPNALKAFYYGLDFASAIIAIFAALVAVYIYNYSQDVRILFFIQGIYLSAVVIIGSISIFQLLIFALPIIKLKNLALDK